MELFGILENSIIFRHPLVLTAQNVHNHGRAFVALLQQQRLLKVVWAKQLENLVQLLLGWLLEKLASKLLNFDEDTFVPQSEADLHILELLQPLLQQRGSQLGFLQFAGHIQFVEQFLHSLGTAHQHFDQLFQVGL
jgi:hypothetical protein